MKRYDHLSIGNALGEEALSDRSEFLVVFVDGTECRYLRWLKRGFRHCFVALRKDDHWLVCDSLKNRMEFSLLRLPSEFQLADFYHRRGHTVIAGRGLHRTRTTPLIPELLTCVAVVKRIIGLQCSWALTPWQLFRLLNSMTDHCRLVTTCDRD